MGTQMHDAGLEPARLHRSRSMKGDRGLPEPADDWALFLDVDGTLLEIAERPDSVRVDRRLLSILSALLDRFGGALALVSGRPLDTLDRLFAPLRLSAAGLHGLERRDQAGAVHRARFDGTGIAEARVALSAFAAADGRLVIEDKGASIALHYRGAPEHGPRCDRFAADLARRLAPGFILQRGKMVAEIRARGPDKGDVVTAFCAEAPFSGRRPVFIGDDVTDEDAFRVVNRAGGHSIRIGAPASSEASWRVAGVAALRDWLTGVAGLKCLDSGPGMVGEHGDATT